MIYFLVAWIEPFRVYSAELAQLGGKNLRKMSFWGNEEAGRAA